MVRTRAEGRGGGGRVGDDKICRGVLVPFKGALPHSHDVGISRPKRSRESKHGPSDDKQIAFPQHPPIRDRLEGAFPWIVIICVIERTRVDHHQVPKLLRRVILHLQRAG